MNGILEENVLDGFMIYISTDYVFDGTKPPYGPEDTPNAVNKYGQQKIAAEKFVLESLPGNLVEFLKIC